jgi:short-subunit dehydrogenase
VLLVARRQDALDDVASGVRASTAVEARTLSIDLTAEGAVPDALELTRRSEGPPRIVVHPNR